MGTSVYPGALDDFAEASPPYLADDDTTGRDHPARHDDIEAAMEAVQGELGTDPAGGSATVKARLDAADSTVASKAPLDSPAFTGTVNFTGTSIIGLPVAGLSPSPPSLVANSGGTASLAGNTVTFTGVSSVSLNGCFTGDYDNYRVLVIAVGSVDADIMMRLRASGADDTSSNYAYRYIRGHSGTTLDTVVTTLATAMRVSSSLTTRGTCSFDLFYPFLSAGTTGLGIETGNVLNPTALINGFGHNASSSFDGFTMYPSSGTFTGTVSIYGYKS